MMKRFSQRGHTTTLFGGGGGNGCSGYVWANTGAYSGATNDVRRRFERGEGDIGWKFMTDYGPKFRL